MRANASRIGDDILTHNIVWNSARRLFSPAAKSDESINNVIDE